jgi:hypothetical protein
MLCFRHPRIIVLSLFALVVIACRKDDDPADPGQLPVGPVSDILFLDPDPDSTTTAPWWGPVNIDIDHDSVTDIELRVLFALDTTIPWPVALWGTQVACVNPAFRLSAGTFVPGYTPIHAGDVIGNALTWQNTVTLHDQEPGGGSYGIWSYPMQGFIGAMRIQGDSLNYGWISIYSSLDHITYQSSAFERTSGLFIHAGDTGE